MAGIKPTRNWPASARESTASDMKLLPLIPIACAAITLVSLASAQERTIARLNHEATPDISHIATESRVGANSPAQRHVAPLTESAEGRLAASALFANSDLKRARALAVRALQHDRRDAEALFVLMEVAGMEADDAAMLDAAVRLCEAATGSDDPRVRLAAVRVRESAANTPEFRRMIPRVRSALENSDGEVARDLQAAFLNASMDGAPGLDPYAIARGAGILTDWRIVGPLGRHPLLDFDQEIISPNADLGQTSYQRKAVENFQFPDGEIRLPDYMSRSGIFYAGARFASLGNESRTITAETGGILEVYVDGQRVLRTDGARSRTASSFAVSPGPHRVLAKFAGSSAPLRIAISQGESQNFAVPRTKMSAQELTYLLAAKCYAATEFGMAIGQINAVLASADSAALQFLLAQAWAKYDPGSAEEDAAWRRLRAISSSALAADLALGGRALSAGNTAEAVMLANLVLTTQPANLKALQVLTAPQAAATSPQDGDEQSLWTRRIAAHPSCASLQSSIDFYRSHGAPRAADSARQRLNGCAPESLAYAQSLAEEGNHVLAASALKQLLAAAPLNRAARLMLVRELQLAGDDGAAQMAAAEWIRVAPNAESYHRLASNPVDANIEAGNANGTDESTFYAGYRRDAVEAVRQFEEESTQFDHQTVILLDDHVAIARRDGSVSLYVHTTERLADANSNKLIAAAKLPPGAQAIQLRIIHSDGQVTEIARGEEPASGASPELSADDAIDAEYVMNYAGDGGIPEHAEAFQFVFGSFEAPVLSARFVTLTPAGQADRGVVIATGEAPRMAVRIHDGMLARVWQKDALLPVQVASKATAIVRVVEQENGWSVPSNAEHQRRIDSIHRGPRLEDSSMRVCIQEIRSKQM
jgi:hypothetical protein